MKTLPWRPKKILLFGFSPCDKGRLWLSLIHQGYLLLDALSLSEAKSLYYQEGFDGVIADCSLIPKEESLLLELHVLFGVRVILLLSPQGFKKQERLLLGGAIACILKEERSAWMRELLDFLAHLKSSTPREILLLSPSTFLAKRVREALLPRGYHLHTEKRSEEALAVASQGGLRVLILDSGVEEENPQELLWDIKETHPSPLPCLILSSHLDRSQVEKRFGSSGYECLVEPYGYGEMIQKIEEMAKD